jgi:hypothetical protein
MRDLGLGIAAVLAILALTWVFQGNSFFLYKYFAPKQEQVRREVFEQSKAYNQGMQQELSAMRFEYIRAAPEHRAALASVILHRTADYDEGLLTADLRTFLAQLRSERTTP